jgi:hypothetical protein
VEPFAAEEMADADRLEALAPASGAGVEVAAFFDGARADPAEE